MDDFEYSFSRTTVLTKLLAVHVCTVIKVYNVIAELGLILTHPILAWNRNDPKRELLAIEKLPGVTSKVISKPVFTTVETCYKYVCFQKDDQPGRFYITKMYNPRTEAEVRMLERDIKLFFDEQGHTSGIYPNTYRETTVVKAQQRTGNTYYSTNK